MKQLQNRKFGLIFPQNYLDFVNIKGFHLLKYIAFFKYIHFVFGIFILSNVSNIRGIYLWLFQIHIIHVSQKCDQ